MSPTNGKGFRATKWTVIGTIVVALLGLFGTVFSIWVNNQKADDSSLKESLDRVDEVILPGIQRELQELEYKYTELLKDEAAARERIARLEGIIEGLPEKYRVETSAIMKFISASGSKKPPAPKPKKIELPMMQEMAK